MSLVNEPNNEMTQASNGKILEDENVVTIHKRPVMQCALDVLSVLGNSKKITLKALGESIPNAVAVANIITEKMLKGNSQISNIFVDSEYSKGKYGDTMVSTIQISIIKN
ncbi:MAG: DNA-binding protein [Nitrosopumilaceae archaeon]